MKNIIHSLQKIEPLNNEELLILGELETLGKNIYLKKGEYLYQEGDIPDFEVYVDFGVMRHFVADSNDNEKIIQFYMEGDFVYDCDSYYSKKTVDYSVQALEDCELLLFKLEDLELVTRRFPAFDRLAKKMMGTMLTNHKQHLSLLMKYNPEERYRFIMENHPELVRRISVTHLAQYLGLSRETLSRMRSKVFAGELL